MSSQVLHAPLQLASETCSDKLGQSTPILKSLFCGNSTVMHTTFFLEAVSWLEKWLCSYSAGGSNDQTAKEMIFEAESRLDKQQKAEHGGVVRGTDAAKVQVGNCTLFFFFPFPSHADTLHAPLLDCSPMQAYGNHLRHANPLPPAPSPPSLAHVHCSPLQARCMSPSMLLVPTPAPTPAPTLTLTPTPTCIHHHAKPPPLFSPQSDFKDA